MSILYKPDDGVAADFIPFFWKGEYHLFYLKDYRDHAGHGEGTPWWHLVTRDFVTFEDLGEALPRGGAEEQDLYVFTGSAIEANGTFHIFYTGHNHHLAEKGKPQQAIMHATSPDLRTWTKHPGHTFFADSSTYEINDWRDPFVFRNDEAGEWWMLLAARWKDGRPSRRKGLTALCASKDLVAWEVRDPFWAPDLYFTHECPDLFRMGEWWYLIVSEFSDTVRTRYRMAKSLAGPWITPADDMFDDRAYYAAKTAGEGDERYLFGWLPTRENESDGGNWQWGGSLAVHKLEQRADGTLRALPPASVPGEFTKRQSLSVRDMLGEWSMEGSTLTARSAGRHSAVLLDTCAGDLPQECLIETTVHWKDAASFGLMLRCDDLQDHYYEICFEPSRARVHVDAFPIRWDRTSIVERPLFLTQGRPVTVKAILDGTCLVVYAAGEVALCCRMYEHRTGRLGLFVTEGEARFENVRVAVRG